MNVQIGHAAHEHAELKTDRGLYHVCVDQRTMAWIAIPMINVVVAGNPTELREMISKREREMGAARGSADGS